MDTWKKRPVTVEAVQFEGGKTSATYIRSWVGRENCDVRNDSQEIAIHTLEGTMMAQVGDWIIKGVQGEFYPCKPDIFAKTYLRPADWDAEYAPKDEKVDVAEPKEWIERQEEERRAWAVNTSVELFRHADSWTADKLIPTAKEIVEFVIGPKNEDLHDTEMLDQFYITLSEKIGPILTEAGLDRAAITELLEEAQDALTDAGIRFKKGIVKP